MSFHRELSTHTMLKATKGDLHVTDDRKFATHYSCIIIIMCHVFFFYLPHFFKFIIGGGGERGGWVGLGKECCAEKLEDKVTFIYIKGHVAVMYAIIILLFMCRNHCPPKPKELM